VPPLPLHPQKISTKPVKTLKPLRQASKSDVEQKNTNNKKTEDPFTLKEKEATVTLYTDDKKHAKYSSYLAHLRYKIDSLWEYPSLAKEKRIEGELTLRFTIRKNGSLIEVKLLESSGQQVLDQEAFRTIHDAAPFKPFPDNFLISRLNVLATFKYQFSAE
jgi:protein TonB